MALGGRPKVEGGHEPRKLSLDQATRLVLEDAEKKGKRMSEVVEKCVKAVIHQFDPGSACDTVDKIIAIVEDDLQRAITVGDFEQVQALALLRGDLDQYVRLCQLRERKSKPQ